MVLTKKIIELTSFRLERPASRWPSGVHSCKRWLTKSAKKGIFSGTNFVTYVPILTCTNWYPGALLCISYVSYAPFGSTSILHMFVFSPHLAIIISVVIFVENKWGGENIAFEWQTDHTANQRSFLILPTVTASFRSERSSPYFDAVKTRPWYLLKCLIECSRSNEEKLQKNK